MIVANGMGPAISKWVSRGTLTIGIILPLTLVTLTVVILLLLNEVKAGEFWLSSLIN